MYDREVICVVEEGWCFLTAQFTDTNSDYLDHDIIINLEGFPTDVNVDLFFTCLPHQADVPGGGSFLGRVENGVITIPGPFPFNAGTGYEPFIYFIAVRDRQ